MTLSFWLIYAVGVAVVTACTIAGLVLAASLFIEWLIKRLNIKREMLTAYRKVLEEREAKRKAEKEAP